MRIRPLVAGFATETTAGIRGALTQVNAEVAASAKSSVAAAGSEVEANRAVAASYSQIGDAAAGQVAGVDAVKAAALEQQTAVASVTRANVAATAEQIQANRAVAASYAQIAAAAVPGSVEQKAAQVELAAAATRTGVDIRTQAAANVRATIAELAANRELAATYGVIGAAAVRGSDEARVAAVEEAAAQARVAAVTGESAVGVRASSRGFLGFGKSAHGAEGELDRFGRGALAGSGAVSGLGRSLAFASGGFLAFAGLSGLLKSSVSDAAGVQKSAEVIRSGFGSAAESVIRFANDTASKLGISRGLAESTAARFSILFRNLGVGNRQAASMTVGFEKLAGSISAIKGADPTQVLQNIVLAAAGNTHGLKQLGISIDSTTLKVAAFKLGLTSSIKDALTPAQKAQAIFALSTQHLGRFMDEARAHASDLANVQRRLSAEFANAKDELGTALLPVFAKYATELANWLQRMQKSGQLQRDFTSAVRTTKDVVTAVANVVATGWRIFQTAAGWIGGTKNAVLALIAAFAAVKFVGIANSIVGVVERIQDVGRAAAAASAAQAAAQAATVASTTAGTAALEAQAAVAAQTAASERVAAASADVLAASSGAAAEAAAAETAAIEALQVALAGYTAASAAASAAQDALAGSEVAVGAAGAAEAIGGLAAFGGGLAALATSVPVVGAAVVGLGLGLTYLFTRESAAAAATRDLGTALLNLGTIQDQAKQASLGVAQARVALGSDRGAVAAARANVEAARSALAGSGAARGTPVYAGLVRDLTAAQNQYRQAIVQVRSDQLRLNEAQSANAKAAAASVRENRYAFEQIQGLVAALRGSTGGYGRGATIAAHYAASQKAAADRVAQFESSLAGLIPKLQQQSPLVAHNTTLLLQYVQQTGRIPSQKITKVILSTPNLNATIRDVDAKLKRLDPSAYADGVLAGKALAEGFVAGVSVPGFLSGVYQKVVGPLLGVSASVQAQVRRQLATGTTSEALVAKEFGLSVAQVAEIERRARDAGRKVAAAARSGAEGPAKALTNVVPLKIQLELARARTPAAQAKALMDELDALNAELRRRLTEQDRIAVEQEKTNVLGQLDSLAKTATSTARSVGDAVASIAASAHQKIADSVRSAKDNLDRIGQDLAKTIDQIQSKLGGAAGAVAGSPQGAAFAKLKKLIESGAPSFEIRRASAELQSQLSNVGKTQQSSVKSQLANLTAAFDKGSINYKQFQSRLHEILSKDGITLREALKAGGPAFADTFKAQVRALREQARAIQAVPARLRGAGGAGGAADIKIVRPLETIRQENQKIAAAAAKQRAEQIKLGQKQADLAQQTATQIRALVAAQSGASDRGRAARVRASATHHHPEVPGAREPSRGAVRGDHRGDLADRLVRPLEAIRSGEVRIAAAAAGQRRALAGEVRRFALGLDALGREVSAEEAKLARPLDMLHQDNLKTAAAAERRGERQLKATQRTNAELRSLRRYNVNPLPGYGHQRKGKGSKDAREAAAAGVKT